MRLNLLLSKPQRLPTTSQRSSRHDIADAPATGPSGFQRRHGDPSHQPCLEGCSRLHARGASPGRARAHERSRA
ncbi:hypothetical protein ACFPRL_31785 [Pseudoclavibacter helvolus]